MNRPEHRQDTSQETGHGTRRSISLGVLVLAAVWGLAEATIFFIVPDVLITWIALGGLKRALVVSLLAVTGALAGGMIMYTAGVRAPESVQALLLGQPGVDDLMIAEVRRQLGTSGTPSLFKGAVTGRPYKIYAAEAGRLGVGLPQFTLMSVVARLARFVAAACATVFVAQLLFPHMSRRGHRTILGLFWIGLYVWYFWPG